MDQGGDWSDAPPSGPVAEKTPPSTFSQDRTEVGTGTGGRDGGGSPHKPSTGLGTGGKGGSKPFIDGDTGQRPTQSSSSEFELQVPSQALHIEVGMELFEDYKVESKLGEGGMGSVWKVKNTGLGTSTALKVIVETNFTDESRGRLRREAMLMAQIKHPNAVAVLRSKVRREFAFIEMEYLKGESIDKMLLRGRPMELGWVARILEQLCGVLEYAHERVVDEKGRPEKIVHRDLKPSNLMIVDDRSGDPYFLKVLDFGIAKKVKTDATPMTEGAEFKTSTGGALFTLPYASPEQIGGKDDISEKSDIYSTGVILYEFLTGFRPFNEPGLIYGHLVLDPPPFARSNPDADVLPEIEAIVMRCLSKDPSLRPTARELAEDFLAAVPPDKLYARPRTRYTGEYTRTSPTQRIPQKTLSESDYKKAVDAKTQRQPGVDSWQDRTEVGTQGDWRNAKKKSNTHATMRPGQGTDAGGKKFPVVPVIIMLLMVALIGGGVFFVVGRAKPDPSITPPGSQPLPNPPPVSLFSNIPAGYEAVSDKIGSEGYPEVIRRIGTEIKFIYIPSGRIKIGGDTTNPAFKSRFGGEDPEKPLPDRLKDDRRDDLPEHDVVVSAFYLQQTEVTNGEIAPYLSKRPLAVKDQWERTTKGQSFQAIERKPAVFISREAAQVYAQSVGGSLPTEIQWELGARSGSHQYRPYVWKEDASPSDYSADINVDVINQDDGLNDVFKSKRDITDQGVLGLMGNAREWCLDDWRLYPVEKAANRLNPPRDPPPFVEPNGKGTPVVRGGSWRSQASRCQTTWPRRLMPDNDRITLELIREYQAADDIGFRVVLKVPDPR